MKTAPPLWATQEEDLLWKCIGEADSFVEAAKLFASKSKRRSTTASVGHWVNVLRPKFMDAAQTAIDICGWPLSENKIAELASKFSIPPAKMRLMIEKEKSTGRLVIPDRKPQVNEEPPQTTSEHTPVVPLSSKAAHSAPAVKITLNGTDIRLEIVNDELIVRVSGRVVRNTELLCYLDEIKEVV